MRFWRLLLRVLGIGRQDCDPRLNARWIASLIKLEKTLRFGRLPIDEIGISGAVMLRTTEQSPVGRSGNRCPVPTGSADAFCRHAMTHTRGRVR